MRDAVRLSFIAAFAALVIHGAGAQERFEDWPVLTNPFPSTGGGGIMIHDYDPVVAGGKCTTKFRAVEPNGTTYHNLIEFEATETQGGVLCSNGQWRSADGSASGTTPFRVFVKDGVRRGSPQ
ncbi:conserved exported hypothetical protein [Bosea sp. 62]|uniref:hypothetical protein n=1 Tax=unclassified Bosea (in: a-proteobacteria) TaxID=2653178 RepID=UPI00125115C4|nr:MULTISPECIES: hypothetical protein [unclassified Bosea (in: a-proteobacteria)]CAD5263445.1 conserved exported hypothetical protein [Bosea sp. 46]CAD5265782.1 conserved exported hypothetical protein [Bosea sp. 21B]CAD5274008.1 conserved exported hypothetical protein [Bosea sp. 7B]VVT56699.1 conserved exported hypothetical protein [Bosea sp. EC-HK365B]VXB77084.1 conserved exported hypothetical protein [Bosea sp. 29B]